jgi:hypothetical protein
LITTALNETTAEADVIELPEIFQPMKLVPEGICHVAYAFETYCILSISDPIQFALKVDFWPACPSSKRMMRRTCSDAA